METTNNTVIITDKDTLKEAIKMAVKEYFDSVQTAKSNSDEYLTRQEARNLLKTTYATLWRWDRDGYLKVHKIGRKVFYRKSDINTLLNNNNQ